MKLFFNCNYIQVWQPPVTLWYCCGFIPAVGYTEHTEHTEHVGDDSGLRHIELMTEKRVKD